MFQLDEDEWLKEMMHLSGLYSDGQILSCQSMIENYMYWPQYILKRDSDCFALGVYTYDLPRAIQLWPDDIYSICEQGLAKGRPQFLI